MDRKPAEKGTRTHLRGTERKAKGSGSKPWKSAGAHRHQGTHKVRLWTQEAGAASP